MKRVLIRLNIIGQMSPVYLFSDFLHKSNERLLISERFFLLVKGSKLGRMFQCLEGMRCGEIYLHPSPEGQWSCLDGYDFYSVG